MIGRMVVRVGLLVPGLVFAVASSPEARSPEPAACSDQVAGLSQHGTGGGVAVLFVHGWTGSGDDWTGSNGGISRAIDQDIEPHGRTLVEQIERIGRADPWVIDYHDASARWVDDPSGAGPLVASAIDCLHSQYGQPVGVIAHSMGGLATRWAAGRDGRDERIAAVTTFGTPHVGSDIARIAAAALGVSRDASALDLVAPPHIQLLRACGMLTSVDADLCWPLPSMVTAFDSPAGRALRTGSPELAALPAWPGTFPVLSIAGEIEVVGQTSAGLFYQDVFSYAVGDGVVTSPSATAYGNESWIGRCQHNIKSGYAVSDDLGQLLGVHYDDNDERSITALGSSPCWHGKLMSGVEMTNQALGFMNDSLPDVARDPLDVDRFLGVWEGPVDQPGARDYGIQLTIDQTDDGTVSGVVDYPELSCGGIVTFDSVDGDTLTLTEDITYGDCVPTGSMTLALESKTTAAWAYIGGGLEAWASLVRRPAIDPTRLDGFVGSWAGPADQPGAVDYSVRLTLALDNNGGVSGTVDYPELSCGGTATFESFDGGVLRMRELITYGTRCTLEGTMTMELTSDSTASWTYGEPTTTVWADLTREATEGQVVELLST